MQKVMQKPPSNTHLFSKMALPDRGILAKWRRCRLLAAIAGGPSRSYQHAPSYPAIDENLDEIEPMMPREEKRYVTERMASFYENPDEVALITPYTVESQGNLNFFLTVDVPQTVEDDARAHVDTHLDSADSLKKIMRGDSAKHSVCVPDGINRQYPERLTASHHAFNTKSVARASHRQRLCHHGARLGACFSKLRDYLLKPVKSLWSLIRKKP